jgi:hypothetical protein
VGVGTSIADVEGRSSHVHPLGWRLAFVFLVPPWVHSYSFGGYGMCAGPGKTALWACCGRRSRLGNPVR